MLKYIITGTSVMLNGVIVLTIIMLANTTTIAQGETKIFQPDRIENAVVVTEDDYKQFPDLIANREANCLALNVYYEARSDNLAGMYAVSDVVLNRVRDSRYPNTICEVVYQGPVKESWKTRKDPNLPEEERKYNPVRNMCQFSWYCDGKSDKPKHKGKWENSLSVASLVLAYKENIKDIAFLLDGATHYHADYVFPEWRKSKQKIVQIGNHIFYKWI